MHSMNLMGGRWAGVYSMMKSKSREDPVGFPDWTYPVSITAMTIKHLAVDIVAQTIPFLKIDIATQSLPALNVNIVSQSVALNVNIASQSVALDVNIVSQAVALNVNIVSQAVDINIKTSSGVNIVIDKLTQEAYTERRSTLQNNGAIATMTASNKTYPKGKFFPRGCRGFISWVSIYCDNLDSVEHTFTIHFAPMPGMGDVFKVTLSVPANSSAAWCSATVYRMWNYDSMFIWVESDSDTYGRLGYDVGEPFDAYQTSDRVTWIVYARRYWFQVIMAGETVGDLPVSGTVNTIPVPAVASLQESVPTTAQPGQEVTVLTIKGCGVCNYLSFRSDAGAGSEVDIFHVYCDGALAFREQHARLNTEGVGASTPGVALTKFNVNGLCVMKVQIPFSFRRELKVTVIAASDAAAHNVSVRAYYSLIA